jgi:hypothetical protein
VPWELLVPFEGRAIANHEQSLERLAARGGLGVVEMIAVLENKNYLHVPWKSDEAAVPRLLELIGPPPHEREATAWPEAGLEAAAALATPPGEDPR